MSIFPEKTPRKHSFRAEEARLVGPLCLFDNVRTLYDEFSDPCLKTFEHQDMLLFSDK